MAEIIEGICDSENRFVAIVDCNSYDSYFPDWHVDFYSLPRHLAREMSLGRTVAWFAVDDASFAFGHVRSFDSRPRPFRSFQHVMICLGDLAFASCESISHCAGERNARLPLPSDVKLHALSGHYLITVQQYFDHSVGLRDPSWSHHYAVTYEVSESTHVESVPSIPWIGDYVEGY